MESKTAESRLKILKHRSQESSEKRSTDLLKQKIKKKGLKKKQADTE